jgi:quinol monooxygenase YgiN
MISVLQFEVTDEAQFTEQLQTALVTLAARPGYLRGSAGRSTDEPARWVLVTEWANVGSYRRALGAYEVKLHATALLAQALDLPSAFEELLRADAATDPVVRPSDRS